MKRRIKRARHLPVSEYQKLFFMEWALAPLENTYNISCVNKIAGKLNKRALKNACEAFINQNELVHAQYSQDGESCYYGNFDIGDFYHESVISSKQPIESQIRALLHIPFDLTKDVLLRLYLLTNQTN